jgi:hypothetical protein
MTACVSLYIWYHSPDLGYMLCSVVILSFHRVSVLLAAVLSRPARKCLLLIAPLWSPLGFLVDNILFTSWFLMSLVFSNFFFEVLFSLIVTFSISVIQAFIVVFLFVVRSRMYCKTSLGLWKLLCTLAFTWSNKLLYFVPRSLSGLFRSQNRQCLFS